MTPRAFDDAARGLAAGGSRRAARAAFLSAAIAALSPSESDARKRNNPRRMRKLRKGGKGSGKRKDKKRKKGKKEKKGKKRKRSGGGAGGCTVKYSEQQILGFIEDAAKEYGQSYNAMVRVARCESVLDPCAYNKSGPYYGLYQYLKSTWEQTPYGDKSIWDPKAQAMATGWMWKQGRKNEWACK